MTRLLRTSVVVSLCLAPVLLAGQGTGLNHAEMLKPLAEQWTSYSGDYSGKRYSELKQINTANVRHLSLAWTTRLYGGATGRPGAPPTIVSGVGTDRVPRHERPRVDPDGERRPVRHDARQRVGARCARRPRVVALLLEDARRDSYRESRRWHVRRLAATWRRRTTTSSVSKRRPARSAGTRKSRASSSSTSRRWLRSSSAITCSSARATTSTVPASCSRSIRPPSRPWMAALSSRLSTTSRRPPAQPLQRRGLAGLSRSS